MQINKRLFFLLVSLAILAGIGILFAIRYTTSPRWTTASPEVQAILWPAPREIADFTEIDQHGKAFTKDDLKERWNLLYFGYLQCPDICPTTLQALSTMRGLMVENNPLPDVPRIIFVSVDPVNDTPERIATYLAFFNKDLVGLSGSPDQLETLAQSLGVVYAENVDADGVRSMEHTTSILVVDPDGRAVGALPAPHRTRGMLRQFNALRAFLER